MRKAALGRPKHLTTLRFPASYDRSGCGGRQPPLFALACLRCVRTALCSGKGADARLYYQRLQQFDQWSEPGELCEVGISARELDPYPSVYCKLAGGQIATNPGGRRFCGVWINPPLQ